MSVASVERLTGVHKKTILKLMVQVGQRCEQFATDRVRNVPVRTYKPTSYGDLSQKKEGHKWPSEANNNTIGDTYTFVGIERHTKLVLCWLTGRRTASDAQDFISRLRYATSNDHFQFTTDGFVPYVNAVDFGLIDRVDFAQLIKVYVSPREGQQRFSLRFRSIRVAQRHPQRLSPRQPAVKTSGCGLNVPIGGHLQLQPLRAIN